MVMKMWCIAVLFVVVLGVFQTIVDAAPSEEILRVKRFLRSDLEYSSTCNCNCGVTNRHNRVVGGNLSKAHEFPWLVGLYKAGEFYCGGSLISSKYVLTAAHCIEGFNTREISVALGDHDRENSNRLSNIEVRNIKKAIPHRLYDANSFNNDIALLELSFPVQFNEKIQTVCLPNSGANDYTGFPAVVAGWGKTGEREETSRVVRKAVVPVWSQTDCYSSGYGEKKLSENMFCAGYTRGDTDACKGDSGGPLHLKTREGFMELIGIVSWGRGCARPNLPGIYTKVTNYLDWVVENMQDDCLCPPPGHQRNYIQL